MIVSEHETISALDDRRAENFTRMSGRFANRAKRNRRGAGVMQAGVEQEYDGVLLAVMGKLGKEELVDALGRIEGKTLNSFAGDTCAELEGGGKLGGFRQAHAFFGSERADRHPAERADGAEFIQELATDLDGAATFYARAQEQGEKLRVVQGRGTEACEFFARPIQRWHVLNAGGFHARLMLEMTCDMQEMAEISR